VSVHAGLLCLEVQVLNAVKCALVGRFTQVYRDVNSFI
jgi:hypothetical protein